MKSLFFAAALAAIAILTPLQAMAQTTIELKWRVYDFVAPGGVDCRVVVDHHNTIGLQMVNYAYSLVFGEGDDAVVIKGSIFYNAGINEHGVFSSLGAAKLLLEEPVTVRKKKYRAMEVIVPDDVFDIGCGYLLDRLPSDVRALFKGHFGVGAAHNTGEPDSLTGAPHNN